VYRGPRTQVAAIGIAAADIGRVALVVTEGTVMPCILQTAIDTQLAGFV